MRALVAIELRTVDGDGRFDLTRTGSEYRALLEAAGPRVARIVPTPAAMRVIEAPAA